MNDLGLGPRIFLAVAYGVAILLGIALNGAVIVGAVLLVRWVWGW